MSERALRGAPHLLPMRAAVLLVLVLVLAGSVSGCGVSKDLQPVTLQLNWYHEAEFVGYYVAEAKGFYEDQGLEVKIVEGAPGAPATDRLLNDAATFAVTSFAEQRDLVTQGEPVVAVMTAFQIPPLVIFSLAESSVDDPSDLVGKRVGTTTNYWKKVLRETLTAAGVDPADVTAVDVRTDQMHLLYEGSVDAWLGYAQAEPIAAQVAGHPVKCIYPADFEIGGYEGLLITKESTIAGDPDLVRRFVKATYDGWRYAVEHADEAAEILDVWEPANGIEFQKLAVRAVAPLVDIAQVPFGWIDQARWQQLMGEAYSADRPGFTMQFSPVQP